MIKAIIYDMGISFMIHQNGENGYTIILIK